MIIVTGGAGFIGSNIIKGLNTRGEDNILLVDDLTRTEKLANIADLNVSDFMDKHEFRQHVRQNTVPAGVRALFHQGACSDTMATDGCYVMDNNYTFSKELYGFCREQHAQFIYASSASVYGNNTNFSEQPENERPLNAYAYSKFLFDRHLRKVHSWDSIQVVGLRYFNVYGYREPHKHRMASVAWHFFNQYQQNGKVRVFEGSDGYANGEQRRDFVFIDDVVAVNLYFLDHPESHGIFNAGTGNCGTFNDVAVAVVNTLREKQGKPAVDIGQLVESGEIEYLPMPEALHGKYQSFTEADITALRDTGCDVVFSDVPEGVARYVNWLLT